MRLTPLLALLIVAPVAHAMPLDSLEVEHTSVQYTGSMHLAGALVAVIQMEHAGQRGQSWWNFTAQSVHVERDEAWAPSTGPIAVQTRAHTQEGDYEDVQVQGRARGGHSLGLFPLVQAPAPVLVIEATCLDVEADATGHAKADRVVGGTNRDQRSTELGNALDIAACHEDWSIEATGSFLLVLWRWETVIHADGTPHDWSSGTRNTTLTPPTGPPIPAQRMMQTYIEAHNASLRYSSESNMEAFVAALAGDVNGTAVMEDATAEQGSGTLEILGRLATVSQRRGDQVQTRLGGDVEAAYFDNEAMPITSSMLLPLARQQAWVSWAMAGLAAIMGVAWIVQQRRMHAWLTQDQAASRSDAHLHMAHQLHDDLQHRRALWHLRRATRMDRRNVQALVLSGRCHHGLGNHIRAAKSYQRAHRILHDEGASHRVLGELSYLVARCLALRGRGRDAVAWLRLAGRHDFSYLVKALKEHDFARVECMPEWTQMRGALAT